MGDVPGRPGRPEEEWDDGASLCSPTGAGPSVDPRRVPEPKPVKNRLHLDLKVSGGRHVDPSLREVEDRLDHVVRQDPEDNEFCIA